MDRFNMPGVGQQFALETEQPDPGRFSFQAFIVGQEAKKGGIDGRNT